MIIKAGKQNFDLVKAGQPSALPAAPLQTMQVVPQSPTTVWRKRHPNTDRISASYKCNQTRRQSSEHSMGRLSIHGMSLPTPQFHNTTNI